MTPDTRAREPAVRRRARTPVLMMLALLASACGGGTKDPTPRPTLSLPLPEEFSAPEQAVQILCHAQDIPVFQLPPFQNPGSQHSGYRQIGDFSASCDEIRLTGRLGSFPHGGAPGSLGDPPVVIPLWFLVDIGGTRPAQGWTHLWVACSRIIEHPPYPQWHELPLVCQFDKLLRDEDSDPFDDQTTGYADAVELQSQLAQIPEVVPEPIARGLPDLVPIERSPGAGDQCYGPGGTATTNINVRNQGPGAGPPRFEVAVIGNATEAITVDLVRGLEPGEEAGVGGGYGGIEITVVVDPNDRVPESDEGNNELFVPPLALVCQ